jgi:hypothetical protein
LEFDSTLFLNQFWKKWWRHAKKYKDPVNLEVGTCLRLLHRLNDDSLRMAANFHLVWEPYARAMTMGSQNSEQCQHFPTHGKSFPPLTTVPAKGGGRGMKWADLLYECDAVGPQTDKHLLQSPISGHF